MFGFVNGESFSIRSPSTEARSLACLAAPVAKRCLLFARIGAVRRAGPMGLVRGR